MSKTAYIDSLVVSINRMIDEHHRQVALNNVPDFYELEVRMKQFDEELNKLSGEEARKYSDILKVWIESIRQMTAALERFKEDVSNQLGDYQNHSSAINAYKKHES